jgi:hypothetical protein
MATQPYSPFAEKNRQFSDAQMDVLYPRTKDKAVLAEAARIQNKVSIENPTLFSQIRNQALEERRVGPSASGVGTPAPYVKTTEFDPESKWGHKKIVPDATAIPFDVATVLQQTGLTQEQIRKLYKGGDKHQTGGELSLSTIQRDQPARYELIKKFAQQTNIIANPDKANPQNEPLPPAGTFKLSPEMCAKSGYAVGTTLTAEQFGALTLKLNEEAAAKPENN